MEGGHLMDARQCTAKSKQSGERCKRRPIPGGSVCKIHGGWVPQVKMAAAERLASFVDPALTALRALIDDADQDSVRLSAIKDILDRAGYKAPDKHELSGPNGGPMLTEDVGLNDDDRATRILAVLERARSRTGRSADGPEPDLGATAGSTD